MICPVCQEPGAVADEVTLAICQECRAAMTAFSATMRDQLQELLDDGVHPRIAHRIMMTRIDRLLTVTG